jgi:hypothetical protein
MEKFTKVLKPIADVNEAEVAEAVLELKRQVDYHLEFEKEEEAIEDIEIKKKKEDLVDISLIMSSDEVDLTSITQRALEHELNADLGRKAAKKAMQWHQDNNAKWGFLKGVLGGIGGGIAGGLVALWAVNTLETKGRRQGLISIAQHGVGLIFAGSMLSYFKVCIYVCGYSYIDLYLCV